MSRVAINTAANFLGQTLSTLLALVFVPLYISMLGVESYAVFGVLSSLQAWLKVLDLGLSASVGREMALFAGRPDGAPAVRSLFRTVEVLYGALAILIGLGLVAGSPWLASHWFKPDSLSGGELACSLRLVGIIISLRFIEGIYSSALGGMQQQVISNAITILSATARQAIGAVVLIIVGPSLTAVLSWQALVSAVSCAAFAFAVHRGLPQTSSPIRFSLASLSSIWRFAGGVLLSTMLALLLTQSDKLILSHALSLRDFGRYTLASMLASLILVLTAPVVQAVYPRLVELSRPGLETRLSHVYHLASQCVVVIVAPVTAGAVFFGESLLRGWTNDADLSGRTAPLLSVLAVGTGINAVLYLPVQCALAHGWTRLSLMVCAAAVVLFLPAMFLVIPQWGSMGACVVFVCMNVAQLVLVPTIMHSVILRNELSRWYIWDVALPTAAALVGVGTVAIFVPQAELGRLAVFSLAFGAVALGAGMAVAVASLARNAMLALLPIAGAKAT